MPGEGATGAGERILIVDDDEVLCRDIATRLASVGYHVVTSNDGAGAMAQSEETPPDIAIVDLEMPTSGLEVIRHLKRLHGPAVHIVVLTGHDDETSRANAYDAGADDFVVKPTAMTDLKLRIAAASRKQRAFVEIRLAKEAADRRMTYGAEASALLTHDLNNTLAISLSNVQYLAETLKLDEDERSAIMATLQALRRMSGLVTNFVDVGRFEDAALKPLVTSRRVRPLVESVIEVNAATLTRNITFEVDVPDDLEARFDPALIERVLHNLVGNASRYCNVGGKVVVSCRPWNAPASLELAVTNSGPQITETIRNNLFGKYVRGGGKRGMGLYFCRLVAEAHGGRIEYEAAPIGPSFIVRLPGR